MNMTLNNSKKIDQERGFTLIELSIVMVIIGLIISGVLVGQDLIHGAQVRATIAQADKYNAAVRDFQLKFQALPGDYASATTYIAGATTNGNGDGLIITNATSTIPTYSATTAVISATAEYPQFWAMLSALQLVEGSYTGVNTASAANMVLDFPVTKVNPAGIIAYAASDYVNYMHMGMSLGSATAYALTQSFLNPADAFAMDTKMDDGFPLSGVVQARAGNGQPLETTSLATYFVTTGGAACAAATATSSCTCGTATPWTYNSIGNPAGVSCAMRVKIG